MKTKKLETKLILNKETVMNLGKNRMEKILGGSGTGCYYTECDWLSYCGPYVCEPTVKTVD